MAKKPLLPLIRNVYYWVLDLSLTLYLENASMSLPATHLPTSVPNTALVNSIMLPILAHLEHGDKIPILDMSPLTCVHKPTLRHSQCEDWRTEDHCHDTIIIVIIVSIPNDLSVSPWK